MENFIPLGRVGAPFGIYGWNHFMALADEPLSWLKMPVWWLGNKDAGYIEVHQKKLAQRNQKWIVQINGNQSPEKALDFVGLFWVRRLINSPN